MYDLETTACEVKRTFDCASKVAVMMQEYYSSTKAVVMIQEHYSSTNDLSS